MRQQLRGSVLLLLCAIIWGTAFVAQSEGMEYVGGFTFNCVRNLIGGTVLLPCIFLLRRIQGGKATDLADSSDPGGDESAKKKKSVKTLFIGGICCGVILCVASNFQQFGIKYTTVGKAGFITALYIVLVPIFGLFFHKKVGKLVWIGLVFAVAGLYFLCITGEFTVGAGDLLVLICAGCFAVHILVIDHFSPLVDGVAMSCIQFYTCGILSGILMLVREEVSLQALAACAGPILYAGVFSSGVAYTLQILGQKNMNPTVASMIMSLESVVSVLAGFVILHQKLSGRELLGCAFMFIAVVLSQLPQNNRAQSAEMEDR